MALDNTTVIPIIWSARILQALERQSTFRALCDTSWNELVDGDRVRIPTISNAGTVADYTPGTTNVTYTSPDATARDLVLAKQKYWGVQVEDIHAVQSRPPLLDESVRLLSEKLAKQVDEDVKSEFDTTTNTLTALVETSSSTDTNFGKLLTKAHLELDAKRVPREGRWLAMSPYGYFRLARWLSISGDAATGADTNQSIQEGVMRTGQVGAAFGFNLYVYDADMATVSGSAAAMNSVETWYYGHPMAVAYIDQVNEVESLRLETRFSTGVRGLYTYGYDVLRPEALFEQAMTLFAIND